MSEDFQKTSEYTSNQIDSLSLDFDENNFLSPQINPENIFCAENKDSSEIQLASKILCFPFNLDCFNLIFLKDEKDPELIDPFCTVILGEIENIRFSEHVLKMVFYSKDRRTPLNLLDYSKEINSLTNFPGIEFLCVCLNKMFIQCQDDSITQEAYNSLQKNYNSSNFLYDEDCFVNSFDNQSKGGNSLFSSEQKSLKDNSNIDDLLSPDKNSKKLDFFNDFDINNIPEKKDTNLPNENIFKESDLFKKSIWNSDKNEQKENISPKEEPKKEINSPKKQNNSYNNQINSTAFPYQSFSPLLFPLYNSYNNISKQKQQANPLLLMQYSKMNPLLLQMALNLQQNVAKLQQMNLNSNDKNIFNKFNGKNNNISNEIEKGSSMPNNKENSANSNTSSTVSSKESSPTTNYHDKSYNNNNGINLFGINYGLFNGFNNMNSIQNLNNMANMSNNNKLKNNKEFNNDLLNLSKANNINNKNDKCDSSLFKNNDDLKINPNNFNLQQIVINNSFKEYVPKTVASNNEKNNSNNSQETQSQEKGVEFHTNSTRDYHVKYVSRYIVQIENEKNFPVTKMLIGNSGKLLRNIIVRNCISNGDRTTKIRLRGKGSGYKEGPKKEESNDPMELCISSLNLLSYLKCSHDIENLLRNVYYQYYLYQCNNRKNNSDNKDESPIVMKKILKYPYVVNRYNTLIKEEKRRKKEEEMKQVNQMNKNSINNDNNENNFINHE